MIKKLGTDYKISEKGINNRTLEITAYVSEEGITLFTNKHQLDFTFMRSKPEMVRKIGKMLVKAGGLEI